MLYGSSMASTKVRGIRVSDGLWNKAKVVADVNDTTVTALIISFLRALKLPEDPQEAVRRRANAFSPSKSQMKDRDRRIGGRNLYNREKVDPALCEHLYFKEIPFGKFCVSCGTKL